MSILEEDLNLKKNFNIINLDIVNNRYSLTLLPKEKDKTAKKIILEIIDKNYSLYAIEVIDLLDNSNRIEFNPIYLNVSINDDKFIFKPKPGVKVITQSMN